MIAEALSRLLAGENLTGSQARSAMDQVMGGEATPVQVSAFLVALRMKGETTEEIAGCAEALRGRAVRVTPTAQNLVDTAGTGGDGAGTFNISTAAALVAASAGASLAKHGNRAVSSSSGSADVLQALGVAIELPPEQIARSIDELGFGFLFAPAHHAAMRNVATTRRELGTRTVFNVLGPLTNPAGARRQLVGVYEAALVSRLARVLDRLGAEHALVVHGAGGVDELTPIGANVLCEVHEGRITESQLDPADLGMRRCSLADLAGSSPEENAATIRAIITGREHGPRRDTVLLNAAAALLVASRADSIATGVERAAHAIDSGQAVRRLDELVAFSQEIGG
ncbi:MAG: anthranilate phosphoribosyltransferase [Gaiellales bacterium]